MHLPGGGRRLLRPSAPTPNRFSRSITAPTSAAPATITITLEESATSGTTIAGLHMLPYIGFGTATSAESWSRSRLPLCIGAAMSTATLSPVSLISSSTPPPPRPAGKRRNVGRLALIALVVVAVAIAAAFAWRLAGGSYT